MTVGVVILCRYSSSRLPGKILLPIGGVPILTHIVDRVRMSGLPFAVATSNDPTDDTVDAHCRAIGAACFRGSLDDVAGRFLACARAQGWCYAARINGDNLFVHYELLVELARIAETGQFDLVTNVPGRTYPPGASVEIADVDFYARCYEQFSRPDHREHVTNWLYEHPGQFRQHTHVNPDADLMRGVKLAIDTQDDYKRAEQVAADVGESLAACTMDQVLRTIRRS